MGHREAEAAAKMLHQRLRERRVVVERDGLVQNRPVPRLTQIRVRPGDQPQGIVVEAAADIRIAPLRQGLILVIGAPVRKLRRGYIENALTGAARYHMDKAEEILTGVPKAHAAPHAALVVARGAAHIERDHALVLVPDVHHPVKLPAARLYTEAAEKLLPERRQRR